jgi:hypothetical protein
VWGIAAHERSHTTIEYIRGHIRNLRSASGRGEIGAIHAGIRINGTKIPIVGLNETIKSRVDRVALDFWDYRPYDLETLTLKMLGIPKEDKAEYFGEEVGQQIDAKIAYEPTSALSA